MMRFVMVLTIAGLLTLLPGCSIVEQLFVPAADPGQVELPKLPVDLQDVVDLPDVVDLHDVVETLGDLELPDLSELPDVPDLDSLPLLELIPGGMVFRGPVQRTIDAGVFVPGTDIVLIGTGESDAEFEIAGLRSVRKIGDSLDFDGEWPDLPGVSYSSRLRIYHISDDRVRIAGVQQLGVPDVQPEMTKIASRGTRLTFPTAANVSVGKTIPGTTYGYAGDGERGAELTGVVPEEYPYRKTGDSIVWQGALQVGGVVSVHLPDVQTTGQSGE